MQERQTQVLALPANAEGRARETEGILTSPLPPPEGALAHGRNPRYSQILPAAACRLRRHGSMPEVRGAQKVAKGTLLSLSLSDGLSQSRSAELPPSLSFLARSTSCARALSPLRSVPLEVW